MRRSSSWPWPGAQTPRISTVPAYESSVGDEAVDLAAIAGLDLDPWQQWVLRHSLGERSDGKWAAFQVGLVVGRQNGKNAILEARELAEVFLIAPHIGPRVVVHSAHQFKTSLEHFRRLKERIKASPEMLAAVKGPTRLGEPAGFHNSHGEESIEFEDGSRIIFAARTKSGGQGRGFTADLLVWDEAMNLPDAIVGDVMPVVSARTGNMFLPGPQVWYTGSAVNQQTMPYGDQLARIRALGISGTEPALFYAEWSVDEEEFAERPEMIDDPVAWGQANPGLGLRIAVDHVRTERRGAMPYAEFLTERMGIGDWPDITDGAGRVVPLELWQGLAEHDREVGIVACRAYAVDTNTDQTWGSLSVAGERPDGLWQGSVVQHARTKAWIVGRCVEVRGDDPEARFVVDPRGPASNLIGDLREAGIDPIEVSTREYGDACADFLATVLEGNFRYPAPQPDLDDALAGARPQIMGERWKWSRKSSTSPDISPLVSMSLALWAAQNAESEYATVLFASDSQPAPGESIEQEVPQVIEQEQYTACFACSQGSCPTHKPEA